MKRFFNYNLVFFALLALAACKKSSNTTPPTVEIPTALHLVSAKLGSATAALSTQVSITLNNNTATNVVTRFYFNNPLDRGTVSGSVFFKEDGFTDVPVNFSYENNDSTLVITPVNTLKYFTHYLVSASTSLQSVKHTALDSTLYINFNSRIDSTNKFPVISDNALLDTVQRRTFSYFWDYGHPVSGLARERSNASPETVTSGGSGFGIMAIPVGINRNFITRAEGLARMQTIVSFLKNTAQTVHGAFPHWLNGSTGAIIPFGTLDNGADLVETSYLMAGLLTARQYFNGPSPDETALRNDINTLYNNVEWDWFRNGGQNILYWHYSPDHFWDMNFPIKGWNECLVTYIMAASSTTHGIPPAVYSAGWASPSYSNYKNGNFYYNYQLPLGPPLGGPLFFSHYSFLGINPNGLTDVNANYETQTKNHTLINYSYCVDNPKNWFGYSDKAWGLTASDVAYGYDASSPTNDRGFIAPTAALSSFPYTPTESMRALKFFYYTIGDKIFKERGFVDAFSIHSVWFANSYLAIDQGPIIVMIENYRSQLIWNLLTSCPEVKTGMRNLGFSAPYL